MSDTAVGRILEELQRAEQAHGLAALQSGRTVAEAVVEELVLPRASDPLRGELQRKGLDGRLGILEARARELDVPRYVTAALRSLQAFGNYANHYQAGEPPAPELAAESVLASLRIVVQWVLEAGPSEGAPPSIALRANVTRPGLVARYFEAFTAKRTIPELGGDGSFAITASTPPREQLSILDRFYASSAEQCAVVVRQVLDRETEAEWPSDAKLSDLVPVLAAVSQKRPERVPWTIVRGLEELQLRWRVLNGAMVTHAKDPTPYVVSARHRNIAAEVWKWFEEDYLGRGSLERHGIRRLIYIGLIVLLGWVIHDVGFTDGAHDERARLQARCDRGAELACEELRADSAETRRRPR
jgi:hypothetical protein